MKRLGLCLAMAGIFVAGYQQPPAQIMRPNVVRAETIRKLPNAQFIQASQLATPQDMKAQKMHGSINRPGHLLVQAADRYLGKPYRFGGRLTKKNPGMDCLALLFFSIRDLYGIPWKHWETTPSKLVRQLAPEGKNLSVVWVGDSAGLASLKAGDLLFFLGDAPLDDAPLARDQAGRALYGWHIGIYAGNGTVLHCAPGGNTKGTPGQRVMYDDLGAFMKASGCYNFFVRMQPDDGLDALAAQYKNNPVK